MAKQHGVTQAQLDQFNAAQKQAKLDARKQELTQEVASGKMTQAQMDQQLQTMAARESNEKNDVNDPKDASEGAEKMAATMRTNRVSNNERNSIKIY